MRKVSLTILLCSLLQISFSASTSLPVIPRDPKVNEVMIPLEGTNQFISLEQYLNLTPKDYKELTGKKNGI